MQAARHPWPGYIGGYIGIMEKKMETTIVYWGFHWDNGKENGNYYSIGCRSLVVLLKRDIGVL